MHTSQHHLEEITLLEIPESLLDSENEISQDQSFSDDHEPSIQNDGDHLNTGPTSIKNEIEKKILEKEMSQNLA